MITEMQFEKSASTLGVEPAVIKAVAEVESNGEGFLANGKIKILFEPHIFWKQLRQKGINPQLHQAGNEDILYPTWKPGKYGPVSKQHNRLNRAAAINREAALLSASWGKFQIMGFNFQRCNCESVEDFISRLSSGEDEHLETFICYIKNTFLDDELKAHDWKSFARAYNGPLYWKNNYDKKLQKAYEKFSSIQLIPVIS
ncbi:MAG: N-acetylmuramidase family protein [Sphingobacteriales bacterium]|nr:MAG: N-acetylmuramidase family protein [Sphingobacteriales bacterium]